ncbi:PQQ-dependent sugar dehydrogenase [Maribius pontilimi]|uniref:PQQ-dependent sugar dehydrogenase n=1 Tax=Palleronia pontilimi TaxID=1964209 RepID=A0A934IGB1_9RHOB|nr:PQQ-dependent sugar dehydrogenase [Palleronia pontilimi]MBJ3762281.1 PQQ-dependent sugar dehydrogenase [Palleronia pontilimi]
MKRIIPTLLLSTALAVPAMAEQHAEPVEQGAKNVPEFEPAWPNQTRAPALDSGIDLAVQEVATGLVHPWGIEVLPDGSYLVTERAGRLRHVSRAGEVHDPIAGLPEVFAQGQGGLLDVALAQDFDTSRTVFLTYSKPMEDGMSATAAARGTLSEDMTQLTDVTDIFVQSPPSPTAKHYGSRVVLDGDFAYITTGEHSSMQERDYAQDFDKTYGKVIRVGLDGTVPDDNPYVADGETAALIWTLGHRNVQGADIRPDTGELWTLEHGPAGGDELNKILKGENYGWPVVSYGEQYSGGPIGIGEPRREGFAEPQYYWDPVIAPGGFAFYEGEMFAEWNGNVLASSLAPGGLVRLTLDGDRISGEERFIPDQGRIRDVEIDADGAILVLVDADNGKVLRLTPEGSGS